MIKEIYLHEYKFQLMSPNKMGIQRITVDICTESPNEDSLGLDKDIAKYFDNDMSVEHSIILVGYRQND